MSKLPASSDSWESHTETSVAHTQVRVIVTAAEEDLSSAYYSDAEMGALAADGEDLEGGISQRRDSFDSAEGDLWPGHEPNRVFRLARQYSGRVKAMNASTTECLRYRFMTLRHRSADESPSNADLVSFFEQSQFSPTRKQEDATAEQPAQLSPSSHSAGHETISERNDEQSPDRSLDESATFPQTNVRDTIRKLKQKALASSIVPTLHQMELASLTSESFHLPSSNMEDDPPQFTGTNASQKPSRQTGSLVQERVRMLHGGSSDIS